MAKVIAIDESQKIRISVVTLVWVVSGIVAFATWMTVLQLNTYANAQSIEEMLVENKKYHETVIAIDAKLGIIEGYIKERRRRGSN